MQTKTCWTVNRGKGLSPVESCEGKLCFILVSSWKRVIAPLCVSEAINAPVSLLLTCSLWLSLGFWQVHNTSEKREKRKRYFRGVRMWAPPT